MFYASLFVTLLWCSTFLCGIHAQSNTNWLGVYTPTGGCTPSSTCCCGVGEMDIEPGDTTTQIKMSGNTDAGQGCFYQKSLNATLNLVNTTTATYSMTSPIVLHVAVTRSTSGGIAITTDRTTCANTYTWSKSLPPTQAPTIPPVTTTPPTQGPTNPPTSGPTSAGGTTYPTSAPIVWTQQLVLLPVTTATPANTQQFNIMLAIPITTSVTYVILHYRVSTDSIQMNVLMTALTLTTNNNLSPSYQYYSYSPINVANGQTLIYSFSYANTQQQVQTSPFYYYSIPAGGITQPTTTPTSGPTSTPLTARQKLFVGTWEFDTTCIPSSSCCCAQGKLYISAVNSSTMVTPLPDINNLGSSSSTSNSLIPLSSSTLHVSPSDYSNSIALNVQLDGSTSACLSQSHIITVFHIDSDHDASLSYAGLIFTANVTSTSTTETLIFKNTMFTCPSQATKLSDNLITDGTTPTNAPSGDYSSFSGQYKPDGSCVPSQTCCCPDPDYITTVDVSSSGPLVAVITTKFKGVLLSCYQLDGSPRTMIFSITSPTTAHANFLNVSFDATFTSDYTTVHINNTAHPQCPSTLIRITGDNMGWKIGKQPTMEILLMMGSIWMLGWMMKI